MAAHPVPAVRLDVAARRAMWRAYPNNHLWMMYGETLRMLLSDDARARQHADQMLDVLEPEVEERGMTIARNLVER